MQGGEVVLSVDCGSVGTSAVVVGADGGWVPVRFDSADELPSAVLLEADGSWLTGQRAWQARPQAPDRFEASPVARLRDGQVMLGGVPVEPVDLVAATLRTVAARAAARLGGAPVGEVRLVVPPGSGPRWRAALREAAGRAGLGQPVLVDSPVAAATHVVATGGPVLVGSFLLVCDWGGGFTASVLRRTRYGFEVLSTITAADGGGSGLDGAVAGQLAGLVGSDPAAVEGDVAWLSTARWAREALSRIPAVTLPAPPAGAVLLTWDQAAQCVRPVVARTAKTTQAALEAADVPADQLIGVFCVGGVAQSPAMVDLLRQETGLPIVVPDSPGRAAVLGAAKATGPSLDPRAQTTNEPPLPPWRQLLAAVVPGLASLVLFWHFALTASLHRAGGIGYDPNAYLLADWGELALAALFALVACLGSAVVIAAIIPVDEQLEPGGADGYSSRMSTGLLAACALGLAAAAVYGIFGAVVVQWSNTPFLRWALLPLLPITAAVGLTAWWVARFGRMPADGWHDWLKYPASSVVVAAVGMVAAQTGLTAPRYPADEALLDLFARAGAGLVALAAVMVVLRRWRYRLILALPLAVVAAGIVAPSTTGILAMLYVLSATGWWAARAWQLAAHPRGALPLPGSPAVRP